jgi:exosortase
MMDKQIKHPILSPASLVVLGTSVGVFFFLWFLNPYSQGYEFERVPLWSSMMEGYRRTDAEWGFGYFVLPAVLALLWVSRDRYRDMKVQPSTVGLAVILFALFLYYGGYKANQKFYGYAAGHIFVAGLILWFGGWDLFKRAFWLWVLFGLIWPLTFLITPISFPLRKLMTILTAGVLEVIDGDIVRKGTNIASAADPARGFAEGDRFNLGIAVACSGLRSLFALGMVSLLYGYVSLEKGWHRLLLFLSALPFAIVGNFVRMMMLYFGTIWVSSEFAIGADEDNPSAYHIGAGIMVFIVALCCMMTLVTVLKGGLKTLRRKKTRVRQISAEPLEPSPSEPS